MSRLRALLVGSALTAALLGTVNAATESPSVEQDRSNLTSTYLVFFAEDKASLAPEARDIVRSAARTARGLHQAKVQVAVPAANRDSIGLAQGRAQSVKAELMRDGVPARAIVDAAPPQDSSFADADATIRAWLDRRAMITVSPMPNAGADELAAR